MSDITDGSDKTLYCYTSNATVLTENDATNTPVATYFVVAPWAGQEQSAGFKAERAEDGKLKITSAQTGEAFFLQPGDLAALVNFAQATFENLVADRETVAAEDSRAGVLVGP